jgi:hypothetical protein
MDLDDFLVAALRDVEGWQDRRDAIVQAALTALIQSGSGVDILAMRSALAAAFEMAAAQEMETHGCSLSWVSLARNAVRMSTP